LTFFFLKKKIFLKKNFNFFFRFIKYTILGCYVLIFSALGSFYFFFQIWPNLGSKPLCNVMVVSHDYDRIQIHNTHTLVLQDRLDIVPAFMLIAWDTCLISHHDRFFVWRHDSNCKIFSIQSPYLYIWNCKIIDKQTL